MKKQLADLYRPLLAVAVRGAETLPPAERADVFDGIAALTRRFDADLSADAQILANAIRDAEGLQLHFRNLFASPDATRNSD